MKKFSELTIDELKVLIENSQDLRDKYDRIITNDTMDFVEEKLDYITASLTDYNIGLYENNYLVVDSSKYDLFLENVKDCVESFGSSVQVDEMIKHCEKLQQAESNLFGHNCEKLATLFLASEILNEIDYAEDAMQEVFNKDMGEKSIGYLDSFLSMYEDYLYDEETNTYYEPHKLEKK